MSKTSMPTISLLLLALLPLSGCEEESCNACKADCPAVNGGYLPWLQISRDDCGLSWNDGQVFLGVTQDLMNAGEDDEWTKLIITMAQVPNSVSVEGELCQTEDTEGPKSYRFSASHSSGAMEDQETTVIAGEFVVGTEEENVCGSMAVTQTTKNDEGLYESCSMSAALYTHKECCDNKENCP